MSASFDATEFFKNLERWGKEVRPVLSKGVDQFSERVMGKAQGLAPVLTGALRDSGTVEALVDDGKTIAQEIGFNTDYAAAVHERLDLHHPQGQAKFLEAPLREEAPKLGPFLATKCKEAGLL